MMSENISNLIRLAADGEISAQQQALLDDLARQDPGVAEAVAFEKALRGAVGRAMGDEDTAAPAGLRARIRARLAAEEQRIAARDAGPFRFVRTLGRRQVPTSIAAGFIVLLGAALIMTIFGLPRGTPSIGPGTDYVASGLDFPVIEHVKCSSNRTYAEQKLTLHDVEQVRAYFVDELGWTVAVPDLSSVGFDFLDAGPCTVNDRSFESVHLRYRQEEVIVSVWIERAPRSDMTHVSEFVDGHAYEVNPPDAGPLGEANPSYYAWRRGEFVYRLVPASVPDARVVAMAIGMPDVALEEFN